MFEEVQNSSGELYSADTVSQAPAVAISNSAAAASCRPALEEASPIREAQPTEKVDGDTSLHGHADGNSEGSGNEKVHLQFGSFVKSDDAGVASPELQLHQTHESGYQPNLPQRTPFSHLYACDSSHSHVAPLLAQLVHARLVCVKVNMSCRRANSQWRQDSWSRNVCRGQQVRGWVSFTLSWLSFALPQEVVGKLCLMHANTLHLQQTPPFAA